MIENYQKALIKGTIRIYDKDKSGAALQLCIQTDGFEKYVIDNTKTSEQLFFQVGEEVLVDCRKYNASHDSLEHIIVETYTIARLVRNN